MPDRHDWNRQTIEAFRANGGKVGGPWEGRPLLLLTTTGADIFRIEDGKIVEEWSNADGLGLLQQLGVVPLMGRENEIGPRTADEREIEY